MRFIFFVSSLVISLCAYPGQTEQTAGPVVNTNLGQVQGLSLTYPETDPDIDTRCINDCDGRDNGDYQSCLGCEVYASCSEGILTDNRPCPGVGTVWDDKTKQCEFTSSTCKASNGAPYDAFFGIPFGKSTAGDGRWKESTSAEPWSGIYNATYFRPYCPQLITPLYRFIDENYKDSEDCLFLNIYVPNGVQSGVKLPVVYFVFGGAFILGMSDMYPGEDLAVMGQVIVVTVNYRVGTLGLLSTGDRVAEGNYGLWDQVLGLRWVNDNIEAFGGDKDRITIMGQSAGAASVSHLSLSPLTRGLFQRVICLSGSATAYFAYTEDLEKTVQQASLTLLCPYKRSSKVVECLRNRRNKLLDMAGLAAPIILGRRVPNWVPRVDGYLVSEEPRRALEKGLNKHLDLLIGATQHEGTMVVYANALGLRQGDLLNLCKYPKVFNVVIKLAFSPYVNGDELIEMISREYPDMFQHEDLLACSKSAVQMITDFVFLAPLTLDAEEHSKFHKETGRSTYVYEFAYRQSFLKYKPWVQGSHVDDLYSVFGEPFMKTFRKRFLREEDFSKTDVQVKNIIQQYYANFVYTGNPNDGPHETKAFWPQFNSTDRSYIRFQRKGVSGDAEHRQQDEQKLHRINFWNSLFYKTAVPKTAKTHQTASSSSSSQSSSSSSTASSPELLQGTQHFMFALDGALTEIEKHLDNKDYDHILQVLEGLLQHIQVE